jgi:hypothetical protein
MAALTRNFISAGGRILISPSGRVEPAIDADFIFGRLVSDESAEHRRAVTRGILQAVRRPAGEAFAKRAARAAGGRFNGWLILPQEDRP